MAALVLMSPDGTSDPAFSHFDESCMRRALDLARNAAALGEVPVGAVIADNTKQIIIAEGANAPIGGCDPTGHAEIVALRNAAQTLGNYRLHDLSLYVTLEPCAMCAGAISMARIQEIIFGAPDPKGGAVLHGPKLFEQPTIHWRPRVRSGLLADDAAELLREFFRARRTPRP